MKINRLLVNVCSSNINQSREFYTSLFAFDVSYDSDWFIHLTAKDSGLELGIILKSHEVVPESSRSQSSGVYLTFVVEDVEQLYETAKVCQYHVLQPPELTFYGQKRLLLVAPEGTVCDISTPT